MLAFSVAAAHSGYSRYALRNPGHLSIVTKLIDYLLVVVLRLGGGFCVQSDVPHFDS